MSWLDLLLKGSPRERFRKEWRPRSPRPKHQSFALQLDVVKPEELLAQAKKLLASADNELDYRNVIERAYYSAYHAACAFEERLPCRSRVQSKTGTHDALLQRFECPDAQLNYGLQTTSKYVGARLRMFKALRELATYELNETVGVHQAEEAILYAEDILDECNQGQRKIKILAGRG